ncbi:MAG: TonB-dependent receptor [Ignavibacteria bacterium]|nr:TonB-dependent receptor [Ignavibacteria bacterium]MBT8383333.1 TonB-dependent receptor [Ignavibacteria bacterium]MBT8391405.1 TonB-dependent receptor [Ignavibacteria bacterium]NNL19843.1 TonB-dependent receptor [Ignavibacteriaceae bacterium]
MQLVFTIIIFSFLSITISGQTKVSGKVVDSNDQPLPGANVFIKDSYDGISSAEDGSFLFTTEEEGEAILVVSFVGYKTKEENIFLKSEDINIKFVLEEEAKELGSVVISAGSFEASDERKGVILRPLDVVTTGSDADIYSALETLPGTQQIGETEGLFVRGGSSAETVTIIDEMVVQKPFYTSVPDIPSRGRFSPFLFKGIVFSTGGYSAKYGQALSSALVLNTEDLADQTLTAINLMILGLGGAHVQRWANSSFAIEGAYYNLSPYFNFIDQRPEWDTAPVGIEGSTNYRLKTSKTGILKAFGSISYGDFALYTENLDDLSKKDFTRVKSDNYYSNINYKEILGDDWTLFAGASFSLDQDRFELNTDKINQDEILNQARVNVSKQIFKSSFITFGGEVQNAIYKNNLNGMQLDLNELFLAGFLEADIFFTNDFAARLGVRGERSKVLDKYNIAPRISLAYRLGTYDQINFAYGRFYQTPFKDFLFQTTDFDFENASHYILNYQYISDERTFRIELYYKDYNKLAKGTVFTYPYLNLPPVPFNNDGSGYAKGIDIFWRDRETFELGDYWLSYSYLDTKRDFINYPTLATPTFAATHTFSAVIKHWVPAITTSFGLTYTFASGRPYYNPNNPEFLGDRAKTYNNLSLNASYLLTILDNFTVIFFSIDNVFGFNNIYSYNYSTDGAVRRPVLPTADRAVFLGMFISVGQKSPF